MASDGKKPLSEIMRADRQVGINKQISGWIESQFFYSEKRIGKLRLQNYGSFLLASLC